jgi:hypothetical protein
VSVTLSASVPNSGELSLLSRAVRSGARAEDRGISVAMRELAGPRSSARALLACLNLCSVAGPAAFAQEADGPRLAAGVLAGELRLDGALDEPAWAAAPAIDGLVMVEPQQGARPTARTRLQVLAGRRALVFGIRCEDPEPERIVSFTTERDGDFESEDHVVLVLDPFQDGRSGYVFAVNPAGARFDALVDPGGEDVNASWDGEWEASTSRDAAGWTAEIRIPIDTLRFRRDLAEWSFNVQRRVQRLQETSRWASPRQDYEIFQTSRAGLLVGLPAFDLGLGLAVRPSLVGGYQDPSPAAAAAGAFEPSLDLTQRLGTNVLASLTVNTDFAETEVDTRETNLTRFPLFFPEKRTFFLEGADIFEFGTGLGEETLVPFFSRRIGIVSDREVPILAGLKSTGRIGESNLGALVVRTREEDGLAPAATLAVVRAKQNVLSESWAGLLAAVGDPLGRPGSWQLGADFTYQTTRLQGNKNFSAGVWGLAVGRDDLARAREKTAFGFKVDYPNDLWDCYVLYRRIGDGFDPSLGFVPRRGINRYEAQVGYAPRPHGPLVRQMFHLLSPSLTTNLGGHWESYSVLLAPIDWLLESGDRVAVNVEPVGERLIEPFEISEGVTIPPGSYHWRRVTFEVETAAKRKLSGEATWSLGAFYGGTLHQFDVEGAWTPSRLVTFLVEVERDIGRLAYGDFDLTVIGTKVRLNLSPDLQLNSFLQYDTGDGSFGTNTRLRWTFHPRGDLFLVYNHNVRERVDRWRSDSSGLLVKVQYTFRR